MRRIFLAALFLLLASCSGGEAEHRVLFIGNSYTHYNDMPSMVEKITSKNGVKIETTMIAPGGAYLHEHTAATSLRWRSPMRSSHRQSSKRPE